MACSGIPCSTPPTSGSWTFTANPNANRFCDDRLIGLEQSDASQGTTLTAIDPVTGCLSIPSAGKGVWQHDPEGCLPDFAGPLNDPEFVNVADLDNNKVHHVPLLEHDCVSGVEKLVKQTVPAINAGVPAMFRKECCNGSYRWAEMSPEYLTNGRQSPVTGICVSPRILAYVPYTRTICDGITTTEYNWYGVDKWQQAEVAEVVDGDIFDPADGQTANITLTAWRTETCPGGGSAQQLVKMGPEKFASIIGDTIGSPLKFVRPRISMLANGTPNLGTFAPSTVNYDVKTIPGYDEIYTAAILEIRMQGFTHTKVWEIYVTVDGEEYSRISLGQPEGSDSDQVQILVPIPPTKILNLQCLETVFAGGTIGPCGIHVLFAGFIK